MPVSGAMTIVAAARYRDGVRTDELTPGTLSMAEPIVNGGGIDWIDLDEPTARDLSVLERRYGLHPLAVEDTLDAGHAAKLEVFDDQLLVIVDAAATERDEVAYRSNSAIVGEGFIITVRRGDADGWNGWRGRVEARPGLLGRGPAYVLHAFLDAVADTYPPVVEAIERRVMAMEGKARDAAPEQLAVVKQVVASLNADARIVEADRSIVPLDTILDTGLFDEERAEEHPLWAKELFDYASHRPESEEYGVESFVYRARQPFDPARFHTFLSGTKALDTVIRAKGHFWLATRPDFLGELAKAGHQSSVSRMGRWWAAVPKHRWRVAAK